MLHCRWLGREPQVLATAVAFGAMGLLPTSAAAQVSTTPGMISRVEDPTARPIPAELRSGPVLGVSGGAAFAGSSGWPNTPRLQGNPDYFSSSPLMAGWSTSFHLMGAITDYFNFGPVVTIATFETSEWKSTGTGVGFRGELFPLVSLVPALANTSLYTQLGLGSTELRAKGPFPTADGTQSFFGFGVHHEFRLGRFLGGHAAAGPMVEYDLIRAEFVERHWLTLGARVVWYGGHVKLDGP